MAWEWMKGRKGGVRGELEAVAGVGEAGRGALTRLKRATEDPGRHPDRGLPSYRAPQLAAFRCCPLFTSTSFLTTRCCAGGCGASASENFVGGLFPRVCRQTKVPPKWAQALSDPDQQPASATPFGP
jgi:hypothetical protein